MRPDSGWCSLPAAEVLAVPGAPVDPSECECGLPKSTVSYAGGSDVVDGSIGSTLVRGGIVATGAVFGTGKQLC